MDRKNHTDKNIKIRSQKQWSRKQCFTLAGIFLAAAILLAFLGRKTSDVQELLRPDAGHSDSEVQLQVRLGEAEEVWNWKGSVAARVYSAAELEENMRLAEEYIRKNLAGEEENLDRVTYKLNLMSEAPGTGVKISWNWDRPELLERDGTVCQSVLSEETIVILTAELRCQGLLEQLQIPVKLVPEELPPGEQAKRSLERELSERAAETSEETRVTLPEVWAGEQVHFTVKSQDKLWIVPFLVSAVLFVLPFREKEEERKRQQERKEELLLQYPDFVRRFVILLGAGMNLFAVWQKLAEEYEMRLKQGGRQEPLYEEVRVTVQELRNGELERNAYAAFGRRSGLVPYQRFASILVQNLKLGADQVLELLDYEAGQAMEERKAKARKRGEEMSTKLLLPMSVQLLLILLVVILPAFFSL